MAEEKVLVKNERCKQCGLCVGTCPRQAIKFGDEINSNGYRYVVVDQEKCIGCGMCYLTCPDGVYTILGNK